MNSGSKTGNAITGALNTVASAASGAVAAVNTTANAAMNAATNAVKTIGETANNAAKAAAEAMPTSMNSIFPFSNSPGNQRVNNRGNRNNGGNNSGNNAGARNNLGEAANNAFESVAEAANNATNVATAAAAAATSTLSTVGAWVFSSLGLFVFLVLLFLFIFAVFNDEIRQGYEVLGAYMRQALGIGVVQPSVVSQITPSQGEQNELTGVPVSPQEAIAAPPTASEKLVEKIMPILGGKEVFNVAQNDFTFYDAEPLCKALGAELATYNQVKEAWSKGADWCNYGWVKGQMAIYPTQKGTYDKLQGGPADEKLACGTVGVNGGVFDNPELRFGVNCYGNKPSQSAHDEKKLMEEGKIPRSPLTLKVDQQIADFKERVDSLFVKPFNEDKWAST